MFGFLDDDYPCMVHGCDRTTSMQANDEVEHGVYLCDASNPDTGKMMTPEEGNHYLQFIAAIDAGTVDQWLAENVA